MLPQPSQSQREPYGLDPEFEKIVLYLISTDPKFWARVGSSLDHECLTLPESKLVLLAVRAIAKERGRGPDSSLIVTQRIRRSFDEGQVTQNQLNAVADAFDFVEELGLPDIDLVVSELVPVVRRSMQSRAVLMAADEYAKNGSFEAVQQALEHAQRLGNKEEATGIRLGPAGFEEIVAAAKIERLPTGIMELDLQMGGVPRKTLFTWIADSGGGKSMALVHEASEAVRRGLFVGFITLELPPHVQFARITSNLTGVPTDMILENDAARLEAERRLGLMLPHIGLCELADFPPHATTVRDIVEWVKQKEQEAGRKMNKLVIDYADKLHEPRAKENEYVAMRYVYEGLRRDLAVARDMWVSTASQSARPSKESQKRIDMHHVADSMHKIRISDVVATMSTDEETRQTTIFLAKYRLGKSRYSVGPIFTEFERARVTPLAREWADWSVV